MNRWAPDLALAALLLTGCVSPPCPATLELYGSSTRGTVTPSDRQYESGSRYKERSGGMSLTLDLQTHHTACPTWAGEAAFE